MNSIRSIVQSFVDQNISMRAFNLRISPFLWHGDRDGMTDDILLVLADYDYGVIDEREVRMRLASIVGIPYVSVDRVDATWTETSAGVIHWSQSYNESDAG